MNAPRILLVSCTPPGPEGVGGIFLKDLCVHYASGCISAVLPLANPGSYEPDTGLVDRMLLKILPMGPLKPAPSRGGLIGKLLAWIRHECASRRHVKLLLGQALALASQQLPDRIWAVLDAPASVALALPLAKALGLPLYTLVWDDPRHIASAHALDRLTSRRFFLQFDQAVRNSERCAVISQAMSDLFAERYAVPCVIVRHGLDAIPVDPVPDSFPNHGVFRIGYAGTMNAPCAFAALVRALDSVHWSLCGRPVELVVTGPRLDVRTNRLARVRYHGWLSTVAETVDLLGQVDVAYLPQPFSSDREHLARYSFPSKLTTYLAARRPLLLHTPSYGSLAAYHRQHKLGVWCNSLDEKAIVMALEPLAKDPQAYAEARHWARKAYERDFTTERFRSSFARFIGVDTTEVFTRHGP